MTEDHRCELLSEKKFATPEAPFHFTASGLSNVFLVGINYWVCPCGNPSAEIPAVKQLMMVIARSVVNKESALNGDEIRFLRKRMGKKASDYAHEIRITPEYLSKLENGHLQAGEQTDELVRLVYVLQSKDEVLLAAFQSVTDRLARIWNRPHSPFKIIAKVTAADWNVLPAAA